MRTLHFCIPALTAVLLLLPAPVSADDRPLLAVMDVRDKDGLLGEDTAENLTEYLRGVLAASAQFVVIDRGRQANAVRILVQKERKETYRACYDRSCQVPLGRALAADKILITSVLKLGTTIILKAEIVDLASEATVAGATVKVKANPPATRTDRILTGLDRLVANLVNPTSPSTEGTQAASSVPARPAPENSTPSTAANEPRWPCGLKTVVGEWTLVEDCSSWSMARRPCKTPSGWRQTIVFLDDYSFHQKTWLVRSGKSTRLTGHWSCSPDGSVGLTYEDPSITRQDLHRIDDGLVSIDRRADSAVVYRKTP